MSSKTTIFHNCLKLHRIAEASASIPFKYRHQSINIPNESALVDVPDIESFPVEDPPQPIKIADEDLRKMFLQIQLKHIASDPTFNKGNEAEENKVVGPVLEIPTEFATIDDFIEFKRELATVYKIRSEEYGFPKPFSVCKDPLCMGSSAPGFEYCLYHIANDKMYDKIKLFGKCQAVVEGEKTCQTPCGIGQTKCSFHSKESK